jgi:hypothetical protein
MEYGLIFWGISSYSCEIFRMQKRVTRIIVVCKSRVSCWNLSQKLKILPLKSQYIFSLLLFVVNNKDQFVVNSATYNINTRQSTNLHLPKTSLAVSQKGVHYLGIKLFNSLPSKIKNSLMTQKIYNSLKKSLAYKCLLFIR